MARGAGVVFVLLALAWGLVITARRDDRPIVWRVDAGVGAHVATAAG